MLMVKYTTMGKIISIALFMVIGLRVFAQAPDNNHHTWNKKNTFNDTIMVNTTGLLQIKYHVPASGYKSLILLPSGNVDTLTINGSSLPSGQCIVFRKSGNTTDNAEGNKRICYGNDGNNLPQYDRYYLGGWVHVTE